MSRRPGPSLPPPAKKPKGEGEPPKGEGDPPKGEGDPPKGEDDIMSVLFETPSGFAIFHCCASLIEGKDVLEGLWVKFTDNFDAYRLVWLKQFKTFEDKSSAIMQNGVNERLSKMIMKFHFPWSKLAVAKPEYKEIVELYLNISCVHGPAVMELMWGIQNCMQLLVPMEKQKLTEADRLPISEGLHALLSRYGCVVKPEMVSEEIVNVASALFWCESVEKENETPLRSLGCLINRVSGINCDSWSFLTIATAIQVIWCPEEIAGPCEEFSAKKISRLFEDRDTYDAYLDKYECVRTSVVMIKAHDVRTRSEKRLKFLVEQAKASEA
ncbi:nucleolar protein 58-like isoform X2 [Lolium rigidum]|uniref:nucleolar protein 58-like isoform X2 n=1 Tax=Lolium rigidum TaxID=89674 RepID=UPI001F5C8FFD|nr:nucleolar protein 58-like isoform X2 [Lolium rigidum]